MPRSLFAQAGWLTLVLVVIGFVHIRNRVVAERYALGEAMRYEAKTAEATQVLRARWEQDTDPTRIEERAANDLGMHPAGTEQILK